VRWFPDGDADGRLRGDGTELEWLACALASLEADVIAVQEFVLHARGQDALASLLASLGRRTGATWEARFDDCATDGRQHVGFLHRTDRARIDGVRSIADLYGLRSACAFRLRPALVARFVAPGGASVLAVNVHLDSGIEARDHANRRRAYERLARLAGDPSLPAADALVLLGDFNTMGCARCEASVAAADEIDALVAGLSAGGLAHVSSPAACTETDGRRRGVLDHVFLRGSREGDGPPPELRVTGPCATSCTFGRSRRPAFFDALSDHCPLVLSMGTSR
jgi:endonuclease/exonuclease/phosphatase family metal-dependent hydrolase